MDRTRPAPRTPNTIARDAVRRCYEKYPSSNRLPVENIYFLSIADFEQLSDAVARDLKGYGETVSQAKKDDSGPPGTGKFMFRLHLIDQFGHKLQNPQFVLDALDPLLERLESAFPEVKPLSP